MEKSHVIFDTLYGYIALTPVEWEIIHTPFYQRLRWIKQLGFSSYVFHGAEHSRFGHSIGVMNNAHHILRSCERGVNDHDLMNMKVMSKEAVYHRSIRIAALLHDLGTFPFSHTTEVSYIDVGGSKKNLKNDSTKDDHENLGAFIIKNTDHENGITRILNKYGIDPQMISYLVKGTDPSILANQILHSEIDCDRMDYLLRDAHYTGLKYGSYDRDYLLYHFQVRTVDKHDILTIRENALHCVEDFLMSRYAWYSQVIKSPKGAMYDLIAKELCTHMLTKGWIYRYADLLENIAKDPILFFNFNDGYFMTKVALHYHKGDFDKDVRIKDMAFALLFRKSPMVIKAEEFKQRLLDYDKPAENQKTIKASEKKVKEIRECLDKHGGESDWILAEIPKKDVKLVQSFDSITKDRTTSNVLLERDPVKISDDYGNVKLLVQLENSVISRIANSYNYIPIVFCSESAYAILLAHGVIDED